MRVWHCNIVAIGIVILFLTACKTTEMNQLKEIDSNIILLETNKGNLKIELFDNTPLHRDNFKKLVKEGFYDSLLFHRVIAEFMVQGGDPESRGATPGKMLGMGGPGYTVPAEFNKSDTLANIHLKGMLAAARQGDFANPTKASSGSQFYIVVGKEVAPAMLDQIEQIRGFKYTEEQRQQYADMGGTPHLDGEYTVFGQLLEGEEVLDAIAKLSTDHGNRPHEDVMILSTKMVVD